MVRAGIRQLLESAGDIQVIAEAGDGEEAWGLIQKLRPAVAVLDIHMPRRSGIELGRLVLQERLQVELIILTMDAEEGLLHEALNLGVKGYLLKENAIAELLNAIHGVARGDCYICPMLSGALVRRHVTHEALREQKPGLDKLSPTERRILKLISEDRTSKEIAELIQCSARTVETHRQNISQKLELSGSHSLLRFAFDHKAQL